MAKTLASEQIKTVLDAIRETPRDWTELKSLRIHNKPIPDKSLHRILTEYLEPWGLISKDKDDGKWSWFLRKQVFGNRDEYNLALEHCKWLVFGGERQGHEGSYQGISFSINTLDEFAFPNKQRTDYQEFQGFIQHIKIGYSQLYQKFEEYATLIHRRAELMKPALKKDPNINVMGFLDHDLNDQFYPDAYRTVWGPRVNEPNLQERDRLERLHRIFSEEELKHFDSNIKETVSVAEDAVSHLSDIRFKLEQGVPLKGYCKGCPQGEVSIKQ